tara:strand:+ start:1827 stop:2798 length:972 start_codon:yes stop_codon:yes gene_type:complete
VIYIDGIEYLKSDNDYIKNEVIDRLQNRSVTVSTSGTTGHPKIVDHTEKSIEQISDYNTQFFGVRSNSRMMSLYSPRGIAFTTMSLYPCMNVGCDLFIETTVSKYISQVNMIKPTHTLVLPSVYNTFSKNIKWDTLDLSSCEQVLMGSDFTPIAALTDLRMKGAKAAYSVYGSTETPPILAHTESDNMYKWDNINPLVDIEIVDNELYAKWQHQDDWWRSGDLVKERPNGFELIGRKLNMFKLGDCGIRVYPEQVEKVAIELGATRALCKKFKEKCYLYYTGTLNLLALHQTFDYNITVTEVPHIQVDNNLKKVIRTQCISVT